MANICIPDRGQPCSLSPIDGLFFKAVLLSLSTLRGQFYESMKQLGLPLPLLCKSDV